MKRMKFHGPLVALAVLLVCVEKSQGVVAAASLTERQLEKYGTRVGRDEYISVFKAPGAKSSRTLVLLSKLFVLPSNNHLLKEDLAAANEITFPGGPLKFRHAYISPSSSPSQATRTSNSNQEKIFFPSDDDESTKKTPQYLYNKQPHNANPEDVFSERKAAYIFGPGGPMESKLPATSITNFPPWSELERQRLTRYGLVENEQNAVLSSVLAANDGALIMGDRKPDELGWYTLLTVPTRSKKASEGCPPAHRKDHRGNCRPVFTYMGARPGQRPSLSIADSLEERRAILLMEEPVPVNNPALSTITTTTLATPTTSSTIKIEEKQEPKTTK